MDRVSKEKRSQVMSSVRAKNTKLELAFFEELENRRLGSFVRHPVDLVGRPDLVHEASRIVVFIDSCFWHGCKQHLRMPKSNVDYWKKKIARNRRRDREVKRQLESDGWLVLRVWEHSIKNPRALKWWLTRIETLVCERSQTKELQSECRDVTI